MSEMRTAPETCGHCGRSIWMDLDDEVFIDRHSGSECPQAPRRTNPAGAEYGTIAGEHDPDADFWAPVLRR